MNDGLRFTGILEIFERTKNTKGNFRGKRWKRIRKVKNLITNIGFQTIANRLSADGTYSAVSYTRYSISNGTATPALTDTAAIFLADGTTFEKAIESVETFSTAQLMQQFNCFLATTDNTVTSITKFALLDVTNTYMFNNVKFSAISKDSSKSFYFRYKLFMTQS